MPYELRGVSLSSTDCPQVRPPSIEHLTPSGKIPRRSAEVKRALQAKISEWRSGAETELAVREGPAVVLVVGRDEESQIASWVTGDRRPQTGDAELYARINQYMADVPRPGFLEVTRK